MLKNLVVLSFSHLAGPLIVFLSTPLLTRLYLPEIIGEYYFVYGAATVLSLVLNGCLFNAFFVENKTRQINKLFREIVFIVVLLMVFVELAIFAYIQFASIKIEIHEWALILPLAAVIALTQTVISLLSRHKLYRAVGNLLVIKSILVVGSQLLLAVIATPSVVLMLAAGIVAEFVVFNIAAIEYQPYAYIKFRRLRRLSIFICRRHLSFVYYLLPSQLLSSVANLLPLIFLKESGNVIVLGYFSLLMRLVMVPANAFSQSIRSTYWNWMQENDIDKYKKPLIFSVVMQTGVVLFCAAYYFISPSLLQLYFGSSWAGIDNIFPAVALWIFSSMANTHLSESIKYSAGAKYVLNVEIFQSVGKITTVAFMYVTNNISNITIFCLGSWGLNIITAFIFLSILRRANSELDSNDC